MSIRLKHWLEGVFNTNGLKRFLQKEIPEVQKIAIHAGIILTQVFKAVANNPVLNFFVEASKTGLDDKILAGVKEWVPKVLAELQIAADCLGVTDPEELIKCSAKFVNGLSDDIKSSKLTQIAEFWAVASSDGKVTWTEIAGLVKIVYDNEVKPANTTPTT